MKYKSDYNTIELRNKLNDLIEDYSEDNFNSHFQNVISLQTNRISGKVTNEKFVIWHYNHFWSGLIYSVIEGRIIENREDYFIELRTKLNSFGRVLISLISCILGYVIITGIVIQDNNSTKFVILRFLVGIVLFLLFQAGPFLAYYISKKEILKMLTENLKLRKNVC